jgi:hypothetical protein
MRDAILGVLFLLAMLPWAAWAQVRAGGEFRVNTYTTSDQFFAAVAMDPRGPFVVVWVSYFQDGSFEGVFGQRYDAVGVPQGGEFQVNAYTTLDQAGPAVAVDPVGNFVVVWASRQDGSGDGIVGQRFDAAGTPRGTEFQVNTYTTSNQSVPAVAVDAGGNFVVVWHGYHQEDGSSFGIFGQRYDAAGAPRGGEFRINTYTTNGQIFPGVAMDAGSNFVVVWTSFAQDGDLTVSSAGATTRRARRWGRSSGSTATRQAARPSRPWR